MKNQDWLGRQFHTEIEGKVIQLFFFFFLMEYSFLQSLLVSAVPGNDSVYVAWWDLLPSHHLKSQSTQQPRWEAWKSQVGTQSQVWGWAEHKAHRRKFWVFPWESLLQGFLEVESVVSFSSGYLWGQLLALPWLRVRDGWMAGRHGEPIVCGHGVYREGERVWETRWESQVFGW